MKEIVATRRYSLMKREGSLVVIRADQQIYDDDSESEITYWLEISGVRIPETTGFAADEVELSQKAFKDILPYLNSLCNNLATILVSVK